MPFCVGMPDAWRNMISALEYSRQWQSRLVSIAENKVSNRKWAVFGGIIKSSKQTVSTPNGAHTQYRGKRRITAACARRKAANVLKKYHSRTMAKDAPRL